MTENNIERKIKHFNLLLPGDIVLLPSNFESARHKDDLNYSFAEFNAILKFKKNDINVQMDNVGCLVNNQFSPEAEISKIVLYFFITYVNPITLNIIASFLYDVMKGKVFGVDSSIEFKIYQPGTDKLFIEYNGSEKGLDKVIELIKEFK